MLPTFSPELRSPPCGSHAGHQVLESLGVGGAVLDAETRGLLAGHLGAAALDILLPSHALNLLREDELDVAWAGHVGVDATVRAVGAAALLDGAVHLDVGDGESLDVQSLDLFDDDREFGVGLVSFLPSSSCD